MIKSLFFIDALAEGNGNGRGTRPKGSPRTSLTGNRTGRGRVSRVGARRVPGGAGTGRARVSGRFSTLYV